MQDYIRRRHQSRTILQGHGLLNSEADDWTEKSAFIRGLHEKLQFEIRKEPGWFALSLKDTETLALSYARAKQALQGDRRYQRGNQRGNFAMTTPKQSAMLNFAKGNRGGFRQGSRGTPHQNVSFRAPRPISRGRNQGRAYTSRDMQRNYDPRVSYL
eukprot:SAG11_NODE_8313_length_1030_cov_30.286788_2_plen_157_part_00